MNGLDHGRRGEGKGFCKDPLKQKNSQGNNSIYTINFLRRTTLIAINLEPGDSGNDYELNKCVKRNIEKAPDKLVSKEEINADSHVYFAPENPCL